MHDYHQNSSIYVQYHTEFAQLPILNFSKQKVEVNVKEFQNNIHALYITDINS